MYCGGVLTNPLGYRRSGAKWLVQANADDKLESTLKYGRAIWRT